LIIEAYKVSPLSRYHGQTKSADCTGLEPVNSTVTGWHDNQLHQQSKITGFLYPSVHHNQFSLVVTFSHWVNYSPLIVTLPSPSYLASQMELLGFIYRGVTPQSSPVYLYFVLRCLNAEPARVFVVLLVFLLLKALLAFFATLFDVLGALAIVQSFCCSGLNRTTDLWVMSPSSYLCSTLRCFFYKDKR
jgi:hypothetical protein